MMLNHFELRHEEHGAASALSVVGEFDVAAASRFRRMVGDLMGAGVREVTVDLADTDFVDSSALGALLWADHRLRAAGGELSVVNAPDGVRRTIRIAGLERQLLH